MNLLFFDSFFESGVFLVIVLLLLLFIMRGLLKYYLSSKIMCVIFSITTIVLAIICIDDFENKIKDFGIFISYTTLSTIMYSFGPRAIA